MMDMLKHIVVKDDIDDTGAGSGNGGGGSGTLSNYNPIDFNQLFRFDLFRNELPSESRSLCPKNLFEDENEFWTSEIRYMMMIRLHAFHYQAVKHEDFQKLFIIDIIDMIKNHLPCSSVEPKCECVSFKMPEQIEETINAMLTNFANQAIEENTPVQKVWSMVYDHLSGYNCTECNHDIGMFDLIVNSSNDNFVFWYITNKGTHSMKRKWYSICQCLETILFTKDIMIIGEMVDQYPQPVTKLVLKDVHQHLLSLYHSKHFINIVGRDHQQFQYSFGHNYRRPPFEHPSIEYFLYSWKYDTDYYSAHEAEKIKSIKDFIEFMNDKFELPFGTINISLIPNYRLYCTFYHLWLIYCKIPRECSTLKRYSMSRIFGLNMLQFVNDTLINDFKRYLDGLRDFRKYRRLTRFIRHLVPFMTNIFYSNTVENINEHYLDLNRGIVYNSPIYQDEYEHYYLAPRQIRMVLYDRLVGRDRNRFIPFYIQNFALHANHLPMDNEYDYVKLLQLERLQWVSKQTTYDRIKYGFHDVYLPDYSEHFQLEEERNFNYILSISFDGSRKMVEPHQFLTDKYIIDEICLYQYRRDGDLDPAELVYIAGYENKRKENVFGVKQEKNNQNDEAITVIPVEDVKQVHCIISLDAFKRICELSLEQKENLMKRTRLMIMPLLHPINASLMRLSYCRYAMFLITCCNTDMWIIDKEKV
ncbi:hypothetical protein BLOT_014697, partial [Blomia tropicalis]